MTKLNKTKALSLMIFMCFGVNAFEQAGAQDTIEPPKELLAIYECKAVEDNDARLACYDSAVGGFKEAQQSGDIIAVNKVAVEKVKRDAFGFNIPSLPRLGALFGVKDHSKNDESLVDPETGVKTKTKKANRSVEKAFQKNINTVTLDIVKTKTFGYKKTRFYFSNKQVWEQSDSVRVPKLRKGTANTAVIKKAALGSYTLRVNGKGGAIRVKRVK